jgi:hypothetical protein
MAEQGSIRAKHRGIAIQAIAPLCVAISVYTLLLSIPNHLLIDSDSYWHIATGRWMIEHRAVPFADPFSYTMRGAHWISFEWLSELAYSAAYSLGGWSGVVILAAAGFATAFGLLTFFLSRTLPVVPTLILTLAAAVLAAPHFLARPHALAMPVMVAWVGILIDRLVRNQGPPVTALPLMILWANLHPSFTLGIALIGPIALEAILRADRSRQKSVLLQWALFGCLAVAAACITPYGPGVFLATYRTIQLGDALSLILEWQPQHFGQLGPFEFVMLLGIGGALYRGVSLPLIRVLVLIGLLHLALSQVRHADLLAMLGPLFLAAPLAFHLHAKSRNESPPLSDTNFASHILMTALLFIALTGILVSRQNIEPAAAITPRAAIAAADIPHAGPVLNEYTFGGYLIYAGIAPFIDGRAEIYGPDFVRRYNDALTLKDLPDFLRLLDEYGIKVTLLAPDTNAVALLDRLPDWQRVYADEVAVVHRRRGETTPSR